ncbi:ABC transporter ATP-binding protein [bacterium]|nr:MAG: ABC transporter ATP-binding protein [bacterium]
MITVRGIAKHFGGLTVLRDVNFSVAAGEIVGLIGPNGAGKSTLFNILCGIIRANSGEITFEGRRIEHLQPHRICESGLTKTSQIVRVFAGMSVVENALVGALLHARSVAQARAEGLAALKRVGLSGSEERQASDLALVDRMRLELARALCTRPRLLLVDELMAGLNAAEVSAMLELLQSLRDEGITLIVIEHNMAALMRLCDRVLALDTGSIIAQGTPEGVSRDPRVIESYLGEKFARALNS